MEGSMMRDDSGSKLMERKWIDIGVGKWTNNGLHLSETDDKRPNLREAKTRLGPALESLHRRYGVALPAECLLLRQLCLTLTFTSCGIGFMGAGGKIGFAALETI